MPKAACILLIALSAALMGATVTGCGRDSGQSAMPKQAAPILAAQPKLIHSPPISRLAPQELRSLSMECEKYSPDGSARGPYDAAYCEDAIAAWADSPLQIVPIQKDARTLDSAASPRDPSSDKRPLVR
jgi:hypothetical protein